MERGGLHPPHQSGEDAVVGAAVVALAGRSIVCNEIPLAIVNFDVEKRIAGFGSRTVFPRLQTAIGAADGESKALIGAVSDQGIAQESAARILDAEGGVVVHGNGAVEGTAVAEIAIGILTVKIEFADGGVLLALEIKLAGGTAGAGAASGAVLASVIAVKFASTDGIDGNRILLNEPVDNVEVVGGFVDEKATGIVQQAVPAAEVTGAVGGIEKLLEIDAHDLANGAGEHDLLEFLHVSHVAHVKDDRDLAVIAPFSVQNGLALIGVNGKRLFAYDVKAAVQRANDILAVESVHGGDDDGIRVGDIQHSIEIGKGGWVAGEVLGDVLNPFGVDITEPNQLGAVLKTLRNGHTIGHIASSACTDDCNSFQNGFLLFLREYRNCKQDHDMQLQCVLPMLQSIKITYCNDPS